MTEHNIHAVVTGGAGFIGSHLVDALMEKGFTVTVLDNLSSGRIENLKRWMENPRLRLEKVDLANDRHVSNLKAQGEVLFHFAANPEVREAERNPSDYAGAHLAMTRNVIGLCKRAGIPNLVFASSSTVYGDADVFPTPEDYLPLQPVSAYGRMKLDSEKLLVQSHGRGGPRPVILRLANIVGPRSRHGVIFDLIQKLMRDTNNLEVLGDGRQKKSYLYVDDCVEASLLAVRKRLGSSLKWDALNAGNEDWVEVSEIAEIVTAAMGLKQVKFNFKPGTSDGRGWQGDVKLMRLDISRLSELGWRPRHSSEESIRLTAEAIAKNLTTN